MIAVVCAIALYLAVYLTDYAFYRTLKADYKYVSRRTYFLLLIGQIAAITLFFNTYSIFWDQIWVELVLLSIVWLVLMGSVRLFYVEHYPICAIGSRTDRCLSPGYIAVKGADIVFQQLIFAAIALNLVATYGANEYAYISYIFILTLVHAPIIFGTSALTAQILTFGVAIMAAPVLYIFTDLGLFWPAVYLHVLLFFFYWVTFSDYGLDDGGKLSGKVDKGQEFKGQNCDNTL